MDQIKNKYYVYCYLDITSHFYCLQYLFVVLETTNYFETDHICMFQYLLQLYSYHKFWMRQPLEYQVHQVFFSTNNHCSLCTHDSSVPHTKILEHLQSDYHRKALFDPTKSLNDKYYLSTKWANIYGCAVEDEEEEEFKFNFRVDYDDKVQAVIYGDKYVAEVIKEDGLGVSTFQSLTCSSSCCLICQMQFNGFKEILGHRRETAHLMNLQNVQVSTLTIVDKTYFKFKLCNKLWYTSVARRSVLLVKLKLLS